MAARAYMSLLETRPITTRVITATLISGLGDAICQHLVPAPGGFDIARTVRFASWAVLITPLQHLWFTALQRRFPSALTRVAFDQLVFAPPATAAFLMYMGGGALVKERAWATLHANWLVWPAVQAINFAFIPQKFTVLACNVVGLFWSIALSRLASPSAAQLT